MNINKQNKQAIHNVVYTDLQRLMFRQYNARTNEFNITDEDYDTQNTVLYSDVSKCNTLNDVNELVCSYQDLFDRYEDIIVFTLDGTLNYVFSLLIEHAKVAYESV